LRCHVEQQRRTEQHKAHDDDHAELCQRAMQQALIAVAHAFELAIDELDEPAASCSDLKKRAHIIGERVSATIAENRSLRPPA
jgi:hypothetical protein